MLENTEQHPHASVNRPLGTEYSDPKRKIAFMDMHNIDTSVLSLANPWLEFISGKPAAALASALNDDLQKLGEDHPGRFLGFGALPMDDIDAACRELERLHTLDKMKGIIVSARGLDDPRMLPLYKVAEANGQVLFVHPHSGVGTEFYGGFGHALFLALGFPFESTVAVRACFLLALTFRKQIAASLLPARPTVKPLWDSADTVFLLHLLWLRERGRGVAPGQWCLPSARFTSDVLTWLGRSRVWCAPACSTKCPI